ncbi:BGTF surface domain-containing protein [Haladaptatus halobius]|uniref:BGTF surface domain-containing protein n=1 Tax=Haladaptatus halobius TaxID=2884875 RepID=UPI001D0A08FD|nr:BGTF surface domain-containing protein [Haladaptatus halobius]
MRVHYISMILSALVVVSLFAGATTASTDRFVDAVDGASFDHELTEASNDSVSLEHEGDVLVLDTAPNRTIRGEATFDPGTELGISVHSTGQFYKSQTVTVQPNGTFNATFDFAEYETGTEFGVVVALPGNNSTERKPLLVVDGVIRNSSATTSLSTTTYVVTETAADGGTTVEEGVTTDTAATTRSSDGDGQPGFGLVVALVALVVVGMLSRRD